MKHEQEVKQYQDKVDALQQQYLDLEDEFRVALTVEARRFNDVRVSVQAATRGGERRSLWRPGPACVGRDRAGATPSSGAAASPALFWARRLGDGTGWGRGSWAPPPATLRVALGRFL